MSNNLFLPKIFKVLMCFINQRLFVFHCPTQDPGTAPARRIWTSIDVGTEIFVSHQDEMAEWTLSDFDVILT